jgi:hypothetical protein
LLHLYKNLNKDTILCREIFRIIDYYLSKNVNSKADQRRVEIDFEVFSKIVGNNPCIREEIMRCLMGIEGSVREMQDRGLLGKN